MKKTKIMKKISLLFALCVIACASNAQISKPTGGDVYFELGLSGLSNIGANLNSTYGSLLVRSFQSETKAKRYSANIAFVIEDDFIIEHLNFTYGIENHRKGTDRMSTYWGFDFGVRGFKEKEDDLVLYFNSGLFTGLDYFIADGLYFGTEIGIRLLLDLSPFEIYLTGTTMNASLKFGYRF